MAKEDFELPSTDERDYLIAGLARVIEKRGAEQFLAAPLLLPEARFFPDTDQRRGRRAGILIQRLLTYAGLGDLDVVIEVDRDLAAVVGQDGSEFHMGQAAGWFHGVEAGVCHFGVDDRELGDDEALIGTLGHEVAHAYRTHHGLVVRDRATEEKLTDLTTVYLGFGVFTLQTSSQFKTGHYDADGRRLLYERRQLGYLSPGQLAFLLGAQLVARGKKRSELRVVEAALAPDQATLLREATRELSQDRPKLLDELRLPPEPDWPTERQPEDVLETPSVAAVVVHDRVARRRRDESRAGIAFRVRGNLGCAGLGAGACAAFAVVMVPNALGSWAWLLAAALVVAGVLGGTRIPNARCSGCKRGVGRGSDRCGFCGLPLVGDIAELTDVFEAEARHRKRSRESAAGRRKRAKKSPARSAE